MKSREEIESAISYHLDIETKCQKELNSDDELSENLLNYYRRINNRSRHKRKALEWVLSD